MQAASSFQPNGTSYTTTWAGGTGCAIGAGSLTARYVRFGNLILVNIHLVAAANTNFGDAAWTFTLPFAAQAAWQSGSAFLFDNGSAFDAATCTLSTTGLIKIAAGLANGNFVNASYPFTWATGDEAHITILYEAANS